MKQVKNGRRTRPQLALLAEITYHATMLSARSAPAESRRPGSAERMTRLTKALNLGAVALFLLGLIVTAFGYALIFIINPRPNWNIVLGSFLENDVGLPMWILGAALALAGLVLSFVRVLLGPRQWKLLVPSLIVLGFAFVIAIIMPVLIGRAIE